MCALQGTVHPALDKQKAYMYKNTYYYYVRLQNTHLQVLMACFFGTVISISYLLGVCKLDSYPL